MNRITVTVEGGLLPDDLLERIADGSAPGQRAADFGLATGRLSDEIMRAFSDAQSYWTAFKHRHERASKSGRESVTTITRESFVIPLLEALAYKLEFKRSLTAGDQSFVISHTLGDEPTAPPVNIVGADDKLDERGSSRRSAHSSVQEYLNVSDCLWGIATNGKKLRVLRDSSRLAKPRYIEFDLEGMMESNVYSDFHLLYRLLHRTRLPHSSADASECWLEKYYQDGIEQGSRVRDRLRDGVAEALNLFGNAFLAHLQSEYLRKRIAAGELTAPAYYRELLRLVYRLLFLMVAEERRLMFPDSRENEQRRAIFTEHYGVNRLRGRAEGYIGDDPEIDLWESLKEAFLILRDDRVAHMLGMAALNGELFGPHGCPHLDGGGDPEQSAFCSNDKLLHAIHSLSTFDDDGVRRRVNFAALDVEELGSVYESLLEYHPQLSLTPLSFDLVWGGERKITGSYYTPPELVRELINSALVPVMQERLKPAKTSEDQEKAILSMRVIDPAAGSGHFLLAAARRMGRELAKVRTGEEEPPPSAFRHAVRDVIRECIYAADKNPLAVDLCKVALWIEGHNAGQPLSFLDAHVKCGDSLVGVFDLKVLSEGIPDDAYKPVTGDDKAAAAEFRRRNREQRKRPALVKYLAPSADLVRELEGLAARDELRPKDVEEKEELYARLRALGSDWWRLSVACDLWTAAFFLRLELPKFTGQELVPTSYNVWDYIRSPGAAYAPMVARAQNLHETHSFFHWPLEFPDVFARSGFDVVLGNPPWERIKLQEKEFFASREPEIAGAPNKAARQNLIKSLPRRNPELAEEWSIAAHGAECQSRFVRESGRFPLCGQGDINTYSIFSELMSLTINPQGRAACIVPTGIATDATTRHFFAQIVATRTLISIYGFENEAKLFRGVDHRVNFCVMTLSGRSQDGGAEFAFFLRNPDVLRDSERRYFLNSDDLALMNPETLTCPVFRTRRDAELTKTIYKRVPVLINQGPPEQNSWGVTFLSMFHMSGDSHLFHTRDQLERQDARLEEGNIFAKGPESWMPLYEGKMIFNFDHRYGDFGRLTAGQNEHILPSAPIELLQNPAYLLSPRYWVLQREVEKRVASFWKFHWFLGWRDVTDPRSSARTVVSTIIPRTAVSGKLPLLLSKDPNSWILVASLCSFILDYIARQKIGGVSLSMFIMRQLPLLPPEVFEQQCEWSSPTTVRDWIRPRVLELVYTSWDLSSFASDLGWDREPFRWDDERRSLIRCELDAAFFHLYSISRDDTVYIMDTFPIVKRKDEERFGEYRSKRLILEIFDEIEQAKRTGRPYQTRLDPPPADQRAAHQGGEPTIATSSENP